MLSNMKEITLSKSEAKALFCFFDENKEYLKSTNFNDILNLEDLLIKIKVYMRKNDLLNDGAFRILIKDIMSYLNLIKIKNEENKSYFYANTAPFTYKTPNESTLTNSTILNRWAAKCGFKLSLETYKDDTQKSPRTRL